MKTAPDFTLEDKDNRLHSLTKLSTKYAVLFFYPKDNTPGCSLETQEFETLSNQFSQANCTLYGISGGDAKSKQKFCEKLNVQNCILLSDPEFTTATAYGAYGKKSFMGRSYMGIHRTTYVINNSKKILKVFEAVKPAGHAVEVLAFVQSL